MSGVHRARPTAHGAKPAVRVQRVLLVDDRDATLRGWQRELRPRGIETSVAHNLAETMAAARAHAHQAAIVDLFLEDADVGGECGVDVIAKLLGHDPSMAVFLVSADLPAEHAVQAMSLGARWACNKPVDWTRVLAIAAGAEPPAPRLDDVPVELDDKLREIYSKSMIAEEGNVTRAADRLGLCRESFRRKSIKLGLSLTGRDRNQR